MSPQQKALATRTRRRPSVLEPASAAAAQPLATTDGARPLGERLGVRKTYKLYIGGEFPRTESGRSYEVYGAGGELLANACRATRKDIREAVRAARKAFPGWAARTASRMSLRVPRQALASASPRAPVISYERHDSVRGKAPPMYSL